MSNVIRLLLLICLLFPATASAECTMAGLWVFPGGQTIKQNSVFILNGYAESQKIISGLTKKYPIYLKSRNKKIKLIVTEVHYGQFHLTQAVLKPETELEAGLSYTMHIDSLPKYERFNKYNKITQKYEPVTYTVISGKDVEKPQLLQKPKVLKKTLVFYGCGPSIHVVFSSPAKDASELIVKTTVKNIKSGKETAYYVEPEGDKLKIGHDMCAGAFDFDDSNRYEVEFSFMDASGNITTWTGERIKFTKPGKVSSYRDE